MRPSNGASVGGDVLVRATDVARTFGTGIAAVVALHDIACEIRSGQRVAITGPSGSGKSTLLHLLAGLDEPTTGTISWPAIGARSALRPGAVAIVFQGPSLLPALDVTENVALPLLLGGMDDRSARAAAADALERLGLAGLAAKLPEELSGGQAQRVAVARVLVGQPRLILADEPTGQLDHAAADVIVTALLETADDLDAALVVTTHDPILAARLDSSWPMADGALLASSDGRTGSGACSA